LCCGRDLYRSISPRRVPLSPRHSNKSQWHHPRPRGRPLCGEERWGLSKLNRVSAVCGFR
jgi:hypothetical protein